MQILNKMKLHAVIKLNLSTNLQLNKALDIFYYFHKAAKGSQHATKIN